MSGIGVEAEAEIVGLDRNDAGGVYSCLHAVLGRRDSWGARDEGGCLLLYVCCIWHLIGLMWDSRGILSEQCTCPHWQ